MTVPNGSAGVTPGGYGVTNNGTVPGMTNRTQSVVKTSIKADVAASPGWNGANTTFFGSLFSGFTSGLSGFISSLFGGLSGTSGGGFLDLLGSLVGTKNKANDAFTAATNNTVAITDLTAIVNAQKVTPAYVGNLTDMPTVPRAQLVPRVDSASFSGSSHQHTYNPSATGSSANTSSVVAGGTISLSRSIPSYSPQATKFSSNGTGYFTPIIVDRAGLIDKFRFITGADSSLFSIDAYYIGLYVLDTSGSAPTLLKFWDPGDIKSSMGSSLNEVSVTTALSTSAGTVTPGQVLFAGHLQIAPGLAQGARSVAWVPQSGVGRTTDVLLQGAHYTATSLTSLPSSVALSALTAQNTGIPWYAVSVNS